MMSNVWSVNLETGEHWWYAHIFELPGCFTRGESREMIIDQLPAAINQYIKFLERHGKKPKISTLDFHVIEEIHGIPELGEAGGAVALFTSDKIPLTEEEFHLQLKLMQWNRQDLLSLVQTLPEIKRNTRPFQKKWTINETLNHIVNAEEWYISRLGPATQKEYEKLINTPHFHQQKITIFRRLDTTRRGAIQILNKAFSQKMSGTFTRKAYTNHPKELWTFRKILRRFVEHEYEHIGTIKKIIAEMGISS